MIELFDADAINIQVTVKDQASGGARDLTGADLSATARYKNGPTVTLPVTVLEAVNGRASIRVEPPKLRPETYRLQLLVEIGNDAQVVLDEEFRVKEAHR